MQFEAEGLTLTTKVGDIISFQQVGVTSIITYTAEPSNRAQFEEQGVSSHSAELSYKEFVRLCTHCLMRQKKDPVRGITTYTYVKDKK